MTFVLRAAGIPARVGWYHGRFESGSLATIPDLWRQ